MDESNFKRINTPDLWESYKEKIENLSIESEGLRLSTTYEYKFNREIEKSNYEIMDIAVDECDTIYCIASAKDKSGKKSSIFIYDKKLEIERKLGCKPGKLPVDLKCPTGIGIDEDTIYIADSGDGRLIALARRNFQIRWRLSDDLKQCKDGKNLAPLNEVKDLTVGHDGNIYVLEDKRVLRVNKNGTDINEIIKGLKGATDIVVDSDGDIYILEEKCVLIFRDEKQIKKIPVELSSKGLAVDSHKNIFFGQRKSQEPTIFKIESIDPDNTPIPLWSFRDKTSRLINDSKANLYILNGDRNKLTFLEYIKVNKKSNGIFQGTYISKFIDSHDVKTHWHRYLLEGEFRAGTKVDLSYYISNTKTDDPENKWRQGFSSTSSNQQGNRLDVLFQDNIEGQYLWFKISLTGNEDERSSPVINSLTVFFPKITYIDYLPSIYRGNNSAAIWQEDTETSSFLERFLSIFESTFYDIDFKIDHLTGLLDAWVAPPEFLSWLGSWIAMPMDDNFSDKMKRLYLHLAIRLYKERGTRKGLEETIALFLYINKHPDSELENILINYQIEKPFIIETFNIDSLCENKTINRKLQNENTLFFPPYEEAIRPRLFRWEEVPGKDNCLLKEFLKRDFDVEWVKNAQIKKMCDNSIIHIFSEEKSIEITLYEKSAVLILKNMESDPYKVEFKNEMNAIYYKDNLLFVWEKVLESDEKSFREYLRNFAGSWVETAKITKSNDNQTICVFTEKRSIDITLKKTENERILDIISRHPYELQVRKERCKHAVYSKETPLSNVLFGNDPFSFYVLLKDPTVGENSLAMIKKIIEEQKPAHTCYGLKVLEPWFYLSMHTYLGVNTYLTKPVFIMEKTSVIGRDTVLDDKEDAGQVGLRSRAGIDTKII